MWQSKEGARWLPKVICRDSGKHNSTIVSRPPNSVSVCRQSLHPRDEDTLVVARPRGDLVSTARLGFAAETGIASSSFPPAPLLIHERCRARRAVSLIRLIASPDRAVPPSNVKAAAVRSRRERPIIATLLVSVQPVGIGSTRRLAWRREYGCIELCGPDAAYGVAFFRRCAPCQGTIRGVVLLRG